MEYYYIENSNIDFEQKKIIVKGEEYKHLSRILGKRIGDRLTFTNGLGNKYDTEITFIDRTLIECTLLHCNKVSYDSDLKLTLVVSPLKNPSRFEFMIEKSVELGVFKIIPVITDNSIIKSPFSDEKLKRLNKISKVSSLLSQRCYFPEIEKTETLEELILNTEKAKNKIFMYEYADYEKKESYNLKNDSEVYVIIGPEGGFTDREFDKLISAGWLIHSLGKRKVRAETAAIMSVYKILNNFY